MHHYCKFCKLVIYLNTWQTDTETVIGVFQLSEMYVQRSSVLYGWLCQTGCSNTTHGAAVCHRGAGIKPSAFVQSASEPADLRKQEFGSQKQCWIWLD